MLKTLHLVIVMLVISGLGSSFLQTNELENKRIKPDQTGSPILPIQSASLVATDALGRSLPTAAQTGPYRKDRYVGIFYFLWHGENDNNSRAIYDITKITNANLSNPKFGPEQAFHWWGEPEAGYYKADDPWVIRRNLQMLTLAGVDVLFFDVTNAATYLQTVGKVCEVSLAMRNQGIPTPYVCFVTYSKGAQTVAELYKQIYAQGLYSDLWFRWQGKPLMLGKQEETTDPAIRDFFTWRYSWAGTNAKSEPHHWQWFDSPPQDYGWDKDPKVAEEIPVCVAGHPVFNVGKSTRQGRQAALVGGNLTTSTNRGLYFEEQWQRALQVKPQMVFVTGWNEWIAQRFVATSPADTKFLGKSVKAGQSYFIDLYNREYNRDIEPMKGGYTDTYYYQLVANIRKFKGVDAAPVASAAKTITVNGQFSDWTSVKPVFADPAGDVLHRNHMSFGDEIRYVNDTGRNDIVESRMTSDANNLYVYAKTAQPLSPSTGKNWMLLYIDADQSAKTGWNGYDYIVNQSIKGNQTSIGRWNGKVFQQAGTGKLVYKGRELEIALPLSAIKQKKGAIRLDFHWADNSKQVNDISEFFINGDSAPDRRFNYRYKSR